MIKFFISCCTTNRFYAIILNISADKHNNFSCITCTIHYIRNVVLEEIVLQTIRKVAEYISQYEPVFLYLYNKQHKLNQAKELNDAKQKLTKSKKRIDELDTLIERIDLHNPEIIEGHKKVKVDISFTAAGLISIPDEKELLHLMNEIRNEKSV